MFSAIIPHRNRPDFLEKAITDLRLRWNDSISEILVVDDASAPGLAPNESTFDSGVHLTRHAKSVGPAACRNEMARLATGDLLLFLDDDSWPIEGNLREVVTAFAQRPKLGAIGFRVMLGGSCESGGAFNAFVGCGAAVRKSAFLEVGGFPEDFGFYVEEYGLCYRLLEANWQVRMWQTPAVLHQKSLAHRDQGVILSQLIRNNRRLLEGHRGDLPEVGRRLDELLNWYVLLGRRLGVEDAVRMARNDQLSKGNGKVWSEAMWKTLSGADHIDALARRLVEREITTVSLWPVGKDCLSFAEGLRKQGIDVLEVLDPTERYGVSSFVGLDVVKQPNTSAQALVVASMSPGQCQNGLDGPVLAPFDLPLYAGFGYVGPNDPPEMEVRFQVRERTGRSDF